MTVFDYAVIAIVVASLAIGAWRGLVGEILSLLAWILAAIAAWWAGAQVAQAVYGGIPDPAIRMVAGYATVVVCVLIAVALVKLAMRGLLKALGLSLTDRMLGVLFGLARGVLIALVLVAIGGLTPLPKQEWWRAARLAPPLETGVLLARGWLPPEVSKRIRFR